MTEEKTEVISTTATVQFVKGGKAYVIYDYDAVELKGEAPAYPISVSDFKEYLIKEGSKVTIEEGSKIIEHDFVLRESVKPKVAGTSCNFSEKNMGRES